MNEDLPIPEETPTLAINGVPIIPQLDFTKRRCILENGIVLGVKPVPQTILRRVAGAIPEPPVPIVTLDDGTEQEWPGDPDYDKALEACYTARIEAAVEKLYVLGSFVESVPEGMYGPLDDRWIEEFASVGITVDTSTGLKRYSEWLSTYALTTAADQSALYMHCVAACGVLDWEVTKAINYFRSRTVRPTVAEGAAVAGDRDGADVPEGAPGADLGVRGEGSGEIPPVAVDGVEQPST